MSSALPPTNVDPKNLLTAIMERDQNAGVLWDRDVAERFAAEDICQICFYDSVVGASTIRVYCMSRKSPKRGLEDVFVAAYRPLDMCWKLYEYSFDVLERMRKDV
jgi:hypothetical protein